MTETAMVDKGARAILKVRFYDTEVDQYEDLDQFYRDIDPDHWFEATAEARAVIEALREPTEDMLARVVRLPEHLVEEHGEEVRPMMVAATIADREALRQQYARLIDAALSPNQKQES